MVIIYTRMESRDNTAEDGEEAKEDSNTNGMQMWATDVGKDP